MNVEPWLEGAQNLRIRGSMDEYGPSYIELYRSQCPNPHANSAVHSAVHSDIHPGLNPGAFYFGPVVEHHVTHHEHYAWILAYFRLQSGARNDVAQ